MYERQGIGIGISNFRELRERGLLFIDKSLFIQEVLDAGAKSLLIPRPRRFGKTLNLSMLKYFLEKRETDEERNRARALFQGLAIEEQPEFREHFARYPVIFLTFKDVKERDFEKSYRKLTALIANEVDSHIERLSSDHPYSARRRKRLMDIADAAGEYTDFQESLRLLSEVLHQSYDVPPVILIDEYDTPIHAAWQHGYYEDMISFMRGLLSAGLKDNPHIFKGVITGILRVAKESIFSDLNNLAIYTILEEKFSDKFGITRPEMERLLSDYGIEGRLRDIDSWYNGYRFGSHTIFNPWSILNFIDQLPAHPEPYWANTSSNALIKELIIDGGMEVREKVERLIAGRPIESVIDKNIVFPELKEDEDAIFSLFFFSGYLKCLEQRLDEERLVCTLGLPNREIRYIFKNIISKWLNVAFKSRKLEVMLRSLVEGDMETFQRLLNEFVITTLSFFDTKGKNPEAVYQAFVLGMLLNLGQEYEISSNRELGYGRYDILAVHRKDRSRPAILMEMKSITGFYEEDPEKAIEDAMRQIGTRAYAKELEARGYDNIIRIVVVSDGKKVWIRQVPEKEKGESPSP